MALKLYNEDDIKNIADAIREKGVEGSFKVSDMPAAISAISGGGGDPIVHIKSANSMFNAVNAPGHIFDLSNMDFSEANVFTAMFGNSTFKTIKWQSSLAAKGAWNEVFRGAVCDYLDFSGFDTSAVTNFYRFFRDCNIKAIWLPSTFVATGVASETYKPFYNAAVSCTIYTDATDAATQGWGTPAANYTINYNYSYDDFLEIVKNL